MFFSNFSSKSGTTSILGLALSILLSQIVTTDGSADAKKLIHDLLDNYNVLERPVLNESSHVVVKFGATLMKIIKVNVLDNNIETNMWLNLEWKDENMIWNSTSHGNISSITIPSHRVWMPDLYFYNHVGENFDPTHPTKVVVKSDGSIHYIPPGIFKTSCIMTVEDYPFDEHRCELKLGSWTHDGFKIDLQLQSEDGIDISSFIKNSEWELIGAPGRRNAVFYSCCPEPYIDITFTLTIRRKGLPIFLSALSTNCLVCSVIILSTLLPTASGHKITLGIFSILFCAWAPIEYNPKPLGSDDLPHLVVYFEKLLVVTFTCLITNVITFSIFYKKGPMPATMKSVLLKKVFPMLKLICPIRREVVDPVVGTELTDGRRNTGSEYGLAGSDLQELISRIDDLKQNQTRQQELNSIMTDWEYLAIVLDRFFFFFWTIFVIIFAPIAFPIP